jgi:hypothetical protein
MMELKGGMAGPMVTFVVASMLPTSWTSCGSRVLPTEENRARSYNAKILSGRIRQAVRSVTNRDSGGILGPSDLCTKTGRPVIDVLCEKHPSLREPSGMGGLTFPIIPYDYYKLPYNYYLFLTEFCNATKHYQPRRMNVGISRKIVQGGCWLASQEAHSASSSRRALDSLP